MGPPVPLRGASHTERYTLDGTFNLKGGNQATSDMNEPVGHAKGNTADTHREANTASHTLNLKKIKPEKLSGMVLDGQSWSAW